MPTPCGKPLVLATPATGGGALAAGHCSPLDAPLQPLLPATRDPPPPCARALRFLLRAANNHSPPPARRDRSTKSFLRRYAAGALPPATGAPDDQANCFARLPPLVALYAGAGCRELLGAAERAIRCGRQAGRGRAGQAGRLGRSCSGRDAALPSALALPSTSFIFAVFLHHAE